MKFDLCIGDIFPGKSTVDSIALAAKAGVPAIEHHCWWEEPIEPVIEAAKQNGVSIIGTCTFFISLTDASKRNEYLSGLKKSIEAAKKMGCVMLISQVGDFIPEVPRYAQYLSIVNGLKACVPMLEASGMTLAIEPVNDQIEQPGYYLTNASEAFAILKEVGSPNVKLLYDIYHQQVTEGDLLRTITNNIDLICHFHAAGHPGRHELDKGEINYPYLFRQLKSLGYQGYVGLEYTPLCDAQSGIRDCLSIEI